MRRQLDRLAAVLTYPVRVNNRHNEEIWAYAEKLRATLNRAKGRCHDVSWSEQMFGYLESARQYNEMEEEMEMLISWSQKLMESFLRVT